MRSAKDNKLQKKRVIKRNKVLKTEKIRQRRAENKHIRAHFTKLEPKLKFKLVDGEIHTYTDEKNNVDHLDKAMQYQQLHVEEIISDTDCAEDEHEGAEELAKMEDKINGAYILGNKPIPSMTDKCHHIEVLDAETGGTINVEAHDMDGWTKVFKGWIKKGWVKSDA